MTIKIKPSKKGSFTKMAKKAGAVKKGGGIKKSYEEKVAKSGSPAARKKAQFALNASKWGK